MSPHSRSKVTAATPTVVDARCNSSATSPVELPTKEIAREITSKRIGGFDRSSCRPVIGGSAGMGARSVLRRGFPSPTTSRAGSGPDLLFRVQHRGPVADGGSGNENEFSVDMAFADLKVEPRSSAATSRSGPRTTAAPSVARVNFARAYEDRGYGNGVT
jgi:hypothetical protein